MNNKNVDIQKTLKSIKTYFKNKGDIATYTEIERILLGCSSFEQQVIRKDINNILKNFLCIIIQLESVIEVSENATNKILDSVEEIQKLILRLKEQEIKGKTIQNTLKIIEACSFQDLISQQIKNIIQLLNNMKDLMEQSNILGHCNSLHYSHGKKRKSNLLNGPQLEKGRPSQKDIDDLFNKL